MFASSLPALIVLYYDDSRVVVYQDNDVKTIEN